MYLIRTEETIAVCRLESWRTKVSTANTQLEALLIVGVVESLSHEVWCSLHVFGKTKGEEEIS